jgi:ammonia channel protein AmtB
MQAQDYATVAVAVCTIIAGFAAAIRWMVKHYLNELKPNSGSSLKDSVTRLERQVEEIYRILLTGNKS